MSGKMTTGGGFGISEEDDVKSMSNQSSSPMPFLGKTHRMSAFSQSPEVELDCLNCGDTKNKLERQQQCSIGMEDSRGVFLTWEDLRVKVSVQPSTVILEETTGYAEPGGVLAIMGPSGSGKSCLLDALAGRLTSNICHSGSILVNGRKQSLSYGTSAYVTQDDVLMTTLTVREAVYYSAQLLLPNSMSKSEKMGRSMAVIKEMGLQDSMDTMIGSQFSRGLSGGEKRRVSICLEMLMRPWLLFMDEPTSGLDSASAFHVMSRIANLSRQGGRTVVVSIHQPSSHVFDLFDNLCLLAGGKTVYFGPSRSAVLLFANNGFPCPPLKNPADHFLKTVNIDFDEEDDDDLNVAATNEAINTLVASYDSSEYKNHVAKRVSEINKVEGVRLEKGSQSGFWNHCTVLTRRSMVNMSRDIGYYWLRFGIYLAIAVCLGIIFYQLDNSFNSIADRGSVLMFIAGFLTFMTIGGFPSFVEDIKIFERERLNGHYGVAAYVISHTLSSFPFLALVSMIPAAISYYMVGLQRSIDHFIYFALVLYACMIIVESLMMVVASVVPNYLMGIITGAGVQGLMMLTGGFFRLPNDIPNPIWKYPFYHIAFDKYADQGFCKNEFIGLTFHNKEGQFPSVITGMEILTGYYEMEVGYSKWVDLGILFGMVFSYRFLFFVFIKIGEKIRTVKGNN